jgi:hypothetical protein
MSLTHIAAEVRRFVVARAEGLCEYCRIAEDDTFYGCQADHVISEKHGGPTNVDNLAMACVFCNQAKGSDIGSIDRESNAFVRFFNPRTDTWSDDFAVVGTQIEGTTPIGLFTARILGFNSADRLVEREALLRSGRYPSEPALRRMGAAYRPTNGLT